MPDALGCARLSHPLSPNRSAARIGEQLVQAIAQDVGLRQDGIAQDGTSGSGGVVADRRGADAGSDERPPLEAVAGIDRDDDVGTGGQRGEPRLV